MRIGNCSGFYGDRLSAMREMLEGGELDYLTGDYLAELTMLILGRDTMKDPSLGYAKTFVRQLEDCLGLALENFNAIGIFRTAEKKQPIDTSGKLVNGRTFKDARDLKQILKQEHRLDFYRCLTEKMLTYALGRGIEYHDVEAVDAIVDRIEKQGGRFSALLMGVIESAPFQKRRESPSAIAAKTPEPSRTSTPQGSNP